MILSLYNPITGVPGLGGFQDNVGNYEHQIQWEILSQKNVENNQKRYSTMTSDIYIHEHTQIYKIYTHTLHIDEHTNADGGEEGFCLISFQYLIGLKI